MKKIFSILGGVAIVAMSTTSLTFAFTQEQQEAYNWAYKYGLTSQTTIETAKMNSPLTRQAFSKMVVNYLENVVGVRQYASNSCYFPDEDRITKDLVPYVRKTCAYQILGSNGKNFNPTQFVDRSQLGTVLSRILWGDRYNVDGKGYYIYHVNALQSAGIMNNIKNVKGVTAKRGDVLIMFKRMYEKYGSNVYLNSGSQISPNYTSKTETIKSNNKIKTGATNKSDNTVKSENILNTETNNQSSNDHEDSNNEYISTVYDNSNVVYTGKNGTRYYYDDKFLSLLRNVAIKKGESDLADYLKIESEYFKNGLNQLNDLDDEELLESMGIDSDSINPENMTRQEKQELIKKFKSAFKKIIDENKDRNNKLLNDLGKTVKNIGKDKFGLKEKYNKTKAFMEASNEFLDLYSESMLDMLELALMNEEEDNSEEGIAQAFGLIGIALAYQGTAQEYQTYVEERGVNTIELLGLD